MRLTHTQLPHETSFDLTLRVSDGFPIIRWIYIVPKSCRRRGPDFGRKPKMKPAQEAAK